MSKHPTMYMEDIHSLNIKISDMLQKHLKCTDSQIEVIYNKIEEILDEEFEWPDYRHHM